MAYLEEELNVSRETISKLKVYQGLLESWQKKINLVSTSSLKDAWKRHFVDSLQLLSYLPEGKKSVIDLGSGAGFPGLVLGIARPHSLEVTLIESNLKKCIFLENVSRETMTKVTILQERIEDLAPSLKADIVVARGLAPLSQLLNYTFSLLEQEGIALFLKGKDFNQEIDEAKKKWDFELEIYPSITDCKARVLKITSIRRVTLDA